MTPLTTASALDVDDLSLIAESIPHIVWMASADGATTYFNRRGTDYTGFPREANYDWDWVNLVHPDDAERARVGWEHATTTETPYVLEYRIRRHDGAFRWHAFRALPIRGHDGKVSTWIGTATDIDEQKQLELSLRESERKALESLRLLESISAATPVGFKLVDRDLRVISINDNLARITGRSIDDHLGHTVAEIMARAVDTVPRRGPGGTQRRDRPQCRGDRPERRATGTNAVLAGQLLPRPHRRRDHRRRQRGDRHHRTQRG